MIPPGHGTKDRLRRLKTKIVHIREQFLIMNDNRSCDEAQTARPVSSLNCSITLKIVSRADTRALCQAFDRLEGAPAENFGKAG